MNADGRSVRSTSELLEMLTERDLLILKDLEQFRLMSTRQIQRLRFAGHVSISSATRTAVRVLGRLEGHRLISRLPRRVGGAIRGSAANIWQLASAGERLLRRLSGDHGRRRYVEPSPQFTAHTLAVADIGVAVLEATYRDDFELLELEAEPDCWREYVNAAGSREWLKPDLFVVTADAEIESHSFIEVDRGTEHFPVLLRKCEAYQRYWRTGTEQSSRGLYPAVVWVIPNEVRATKLLAAIRAHPTLTDELFHVTTQTEAMSIIGTGRELELTKGGTP